jgi:hypothetical protein
MADEKNWREQEESLKEVIQKYPDIPPLLILKIDVQRRGVVYTEAALAKLDPKIHQTNLGGDVAGLRVGAKMAPESLLLKDGSLLILSYDFDENKPERDPYIVDVVDDHIYLTDQGEVLEEVWYWEKPDFFDKKTSGGQPMSDYVTARPQRLDVSFSKYCHFWDNPGEGCKYCCWTPNFKKSGCTEARNNVKYVGEAIREALKQEGRYSSVLLTGGSVLGGEEILDEELEGYIALLQEIGKYFKPGRFPSQLISSAFNERQLDRLYNETGLMTYTTDIEVLNKEKFEWICPGKAKRIGYEEWKRRLYASVDVFGFGNVSSGVVLGTELAKPNGFPNEDEAYKNIIEEAEEIISHGIALAANVWRAAPGSMFQNQDTPSLDYYIRCYREFDRLAHHYGVNPYMDDFRRCGAHPGQDLLRI